MTNNTLERVLQKKKKPFLFWLNLVFVAKMLTICYDPPTGWAYKAQATKAISVNLEPVEPTGALPAGSDLSN